MVLQLTNFENRLMERRNWSEGGGYFAVEGGEVGFTEIRFPKH